MLDISFWHKAAERQLSAFGRKTDIRSASDFRGAPDVQLNGFWNLGREPIKSCAATVALANPVSP
jgi:hypothetical protein